MVESREAVEQDLAIQFAAGDDGVLEGVYAANGALVYSYSTAVFLNISGCLAVD